MTDALVLTPGTLQQSSFNKVGDGLHYDGIELATSGTKITYTAKTPIQLNPGTTISGDDKATIQLIPYAPVGTWSSQTPVFSLSGENYLFERFTFDGLAGKQSVKWGKGYHNLLGGNKATNVTVHDLIIQNSLGDGGRFTDSQNIKFYNNKIYGIGHDGLYVDRCTDVEAYGNTIYTRINSALRSKGSAKVRFYNNYISSTNKYTPRTGPGIQVENSKANETTSDVQIYSNWIEGCQGPGIWAAGHTATATDAAKQLIIRNNVIKACGQMPVLKSATEAAKLSKVAAICLDGWTDFEIYDNTLDNNCNGIRLGTYITTSAGTGYTGTIKNNIITNTVAPNNKDVYAGYAIADTSGKFKVTCSGNDLWGNLKSIYGLDNKSGLSVNPGYADAQYRLLTTSPCVFSGYQLGRYNNATPVEENTPVEPNEPEDQLVDLYVTCSESDADTIVNNISNCTIYR